MLRRRMRPKPALVRGRWFETLAPPVPSSARPGVP